MMWQFSRMVMVGGIQMDGARRIMSMPSDMFSDLLKSSISPVFDERWYLNKYPDVGRAIEEGTVQTALEHYVEHGFYENRMPYAIKIDEAYYTSKYEDVKQAVDRAQIRSAQEHFDEHGFREGRLPSEDWELLSGPASIDFRSAGGAAVREEADGARRRK